MNESLWRKFEETRKSRANLSFILACEKSLIIITRNKEHESCCKLLQKFSAKIS